MYSTPIYRPGPLSGYSTIGPFMIFGPLDPFLGCYNHPS
jgi:hypothetical protein